MLFRSETAITQHQMQTILAMITYNAMLSNDKNTRVMSQQRHLTAESIWET